ETGLEHYDARRLGWKVQVLEKAPDPARTAPLEYRKVYDTTKPGRGNGGHTFGDKLTEEERMAGIEYLKTLGYGPRWAPRAALRHLHVPAERLVGQPAALGPQQRQVVQGLGVVRVQFQDLFQPRCRVGVWSTRTVTFPGAVMLRDPIDIDRAIPWLGRPPIYLI